MRILLYNFAVPGDGNPDAGGVGVYLESLSQALYNNGETVILLSSGHDYSPWRTDPYIAFSGSGRAWRAKIVNSPVIAPAHETFFSLKSYLDSSGLNVMPALLKKRFGDLDVLHFHNIEGLTVGFLQEARKVFPRARVLLSAHNYSMVCPQVNLWRNGRHSCTNYDDGHACASCIPFRTAEFKKRVRAAWWLRAKTAYLPDAWATFLLRHRGLPTEKEIHLPFKLTTTSQIVNTAELADSFRRYRAKNIELASTVFDSILAVSDRTRAVLLEHGLRPKNLITSYIGSAQVSPDVMSKNYPSADDNLHIAYLGYARRDKGFHLLLNALDLLPDRIAKRLEVTIAAKMTDPKTIARLNKLGARLVSINLINGYNNSQLPSILKSIDLGIVPPIWEDNLPQIAIEFVAHRVPILTSDAGGASEIGKNSDFVFEASSAPSLANALERILERKVLLVDFWRHPPNIRSLRAHLAELLPLYSNSSTTAASATVAEME